MRRVILIIPAFFCLIVGLAFFVTPIPLGIPLVGLSILLFIAASRNFTRLVIANRRASPKMDRMFDYMERRGGSQVRKALRRTRPGRFPKAG